MLTEKGASMKTDKWLRMLLTGEIYPNRSVIIFDVPEDVWKRATSSQVGRDLEFSSKSLDYAAGHHCGEALIKIFYENDDEGPECRPRLRRIAKELHRFHRALTALGAPCRPRIYHHRGRFPKWILRPWSDTLRWARSGRRDPETRYPVRH